MSIEMIAMQSHEKKIGQCLVCKKELDGGIDEFCCKECEEEWGLWTEE